MTSTVTTKPSGNRLTRFISGLWAEMKKVVWLSRREVAYLTGLVLLVTVATGILLNLIILQIEMMCMISGGQAKIVPATVSEVFGGR